jgi:hypothetical protein
MSLQIIINNNTAHNFSRYNWASSWNQLVQ